MSMQNNIKTDNILNNLIKISIICLIGYITYLIYPVIILLYIGFVLACMLKPLHTILNKLIHNSSISSLICLGFLISAVYLSIFLLLPAFINQANILQKTISNSTLHLPNFINQIFGNTILGNNADMFINTIKASILKNIDYIASTLLSLISAQSFYAVSLLIKFYFTILISFHILTDWNKFEHKITHFMPQSHSNKVIKTISEISASIKTLINGQFSIIGILILFYSMMLFLISFPHFLLFSVLLAMSSLVPYLGIITTYSFILLYSINLYHAAHININQIYIFTFFVILGNILESSVLSPYFLGKKLNIHPLIFLIYILSLSTLFGIGGIIIALPTISIAHIIIKKTTKTILDYLFT